jgi:niacin transporter
MKAFVRPKRSSLSAYFNFWRFIYMSNIKKTVTAALLITLGIVLPMAFHSIPNAGGIFLPMHIPVLLCGLICGLPYGFACGVITPLLSSLLTGMPPSAMLPQMLCELAVYGTVTALLIRFAPAKNIYARIYISLIGAMLSGRVVYGILNAVIFKAGVYSMQIWTSAAFMTALPGIAIQLFLIPAIIFALKKAKLIDFGQRGGQ